MRDPLIRQLRLRLRLLERLTANEIPGELFACADIADKIGQPQFASFLRRLGMASKTTIIEAAKIAIWVEQRNAQIVELFELIDKALRQSRTQRPKIALAFLVKAMLIADEIDPPLSDALTVWAREIKAL